MIEKRNIIIIILAAIIVALAGLVAFTLISETEFQSIQISEGTTIDVPKTDDATWTQNEFGIKTYTCKSKHVVLTSFNSQENQNIVGAGAFAIARDALLNGSSSVENYNGYGIRENTINNTNYYIVSISNNATHDNIIIGSEDLNMLKDIIDTLRFGMPGEAKVADATAAQSSSSSKPTNDSSSDDIFDESYYYQLGVSDGQLEGYYYGYTDGYDDSYYDNYDYYNYYYDDSNYYDYNVESTTDEIY